MHGLQNMDANKQKIMEIMKRIYGERTGCSNGGLTGEYFLCPVPNYGAIKAAKNGWLAITCFKKLPEHFFYNFQFVSFKIRQDIPFGRFIIVCAINC